MTVTVIKWHADNAVHEVQVVTSNEEICSSQEKNEHIAYYYKINKRENIHFTNAGKDKFPTLMFISLLYCSTVRRNLKGFYTDIFLSFLFLFFAHTSVIKILNSSRVMYHVNSRKVALIHRWYSRERSSSPVTLSRGWAELEVETTHKHIHEMFYTAPEAKTLDIFNYYLKSRNKTDLFK